MNKKVLTALAACAALSSALVATAPAAMAAGTPRTTVDAWYGDFLGRDADQGSQYWVDQLSNGARPGDPLWSITHSNEFNANYIEILYGSSFERAPDAGARYWQQGADAQRFPLEWVLQNVVSSPEYVRVSGGSRAAVVSKWYDEIFGYDSGRTPSRGETSYWSGRIGAAGYLAAFRELYYAPEAVQSRVTDAYGYLLGRDPSAGEVSYWYPKEVESSINVEVLIASSPEYIDLNG